MVSAYNQPSVCLVVDELDAGIYEYLLGELLGELQKEMKGQLIFTSHNLRVLEKLDYKNIICSTINPKNRYIKEQIIIIGIFILNRLQLVDKKRNYMMTRIWILLDMHSEEQEIQRRRM